MTFIQYLESPWGQLAVRADEKGVTAVTFTDESSDQSHPSALTQQAVLQLEQYISGTRTAFSLPLNPGGTAFQQSVWQALTRIPYGTTTSYADIAEKLNNPKAVRAVGMANSRNPVAIVVPCHRVIGRNGTLTGYVGGLDRKAALLRHEGGWEI